MSRLITPFELRELIDRDASLRLIDVRSAAEFASGHVPGAVNIPMEQVESRLDDISRSGEVVLICQGGKRAAVTADWICDRRDVKVLEGGTQAWIDSKLPIVECVACRWSLERQVRFGAGVLILIGTLLTFVAWYWVFLAMLVGAGLTMAGATGFCPMAIALGKMPWNRASAKILPNKAQASSCCS